MDDGRKLSSESRPAGLDDAMRSTMDTVIEVGSRWLRFGKALSPDIGFVGAAPAAPPAPPWREFSRFRTASEALELS